MKLKNAFKKFTLFSLFALSLAGCGNDTPYSKPIDFSDKTGNEKHLSGNFLSTLPDGAHIIHLKKDDTFLFAIKDRDNAGQSGYGFFAMDDIKPEHIRNDIPADLTTSGLDVWHIELGDLIQDLPNGFHTKTFSNKNLKQEIKASLIKDQNSIGYIGFGYLGMTIKPN